MDDDRPPPQFSPDGRYWWDGEQWVPVEHLPRPLPEPASRTVWSTTQGEVPWHRVLLLAAAAVIAVLVIATGVGLATGAIRGPHGLPLTAAPTPMPTHAPTPTPFSAIPGLTPPQLVATLHSRGFTCSTPSRDATGLTWQCQARRGALSYIVIFVGPDEQRVRGLRASATDSSPQPDPANVQPFLDLIASLPIQHVNGSRAQAWVDTHLAGGVQRFGPVFYRTQRDPTGHTWILGIYVG